MKLWAKHRRGGLDGFQVADLQAVPIEMYSWVTQLFDSVERTGNWPYPLTLGLVAMVPKECDTVDPLKHRPNYNEPIL